MSTTSNRWFSLIGLVTLTALPGFAQTAGEKVKASVNDGTRAVKKTVHRAGEALCTGTEVECAKKKLQNRGTEAKDAVKDKVEEVKDKVD